MDTTMKTRIEERAFELFLERGGTHGYAMDDWIRAEQELTGSAPKKKTPRHKKEVVVEKA